MSGETGGTGKFRSKGFRFLGLDLQDFIKFFFSGNASLAIIILILICVFLFREAYLFFPDHHRGLKAYRQSGQEYVDFVSEEISVFKSLYSNANVAYLTEINRTSVKEDNLLAAYRSVLSIAENKTARFRDQMEDDLDELEDVLDDLEDAKDDLSDLDPVDDASEIEELTKEIEDLNREKSSLESNITRLRPILQGKTREVLNNNSSWDFDNSNLTLSEEQKNAIREAVVQSEPNADSDHPFIVNLKNVSKEKKAIEAERFATFGDAVKGLNTAARPLKKLHGDLLKVASESKRIAEKSKTSAARKEALLAGAQKTKDPEEKARKLKMADEVIIEKPDFSTLCQPLYDSRDEHTKIIKDFSVDVQRLIALFPEETETDKAREKLKLAFQANRELEAVIRRNEKAVPQWRHDEPYSIGRSVRAFIFGRDWTTNSSWHDFYGLLPLFTGSLSISLVALVVAIPFAISAAIYLNQLASAREQNWIKPAIEFIGAIPSVVLGFFGILVLGETLRMVSQIEWLAWIPGFPMTERLTILTAGLLLAFMAIPTIFTLAEDAINNVPKALTENSLALGASKVQTIFRVIVPSALSGIIAAVLLGFGRIIGETMVVLLVAGNKIKIPDSLTDPAHTMTGIIAQELGEVDNGSLHWRALFMVGMVLFVISLSVNYSSQKILKRFQQV